MRSYQLYRTFFIYFFILNYQVICAQLDTTHYLSPLHSRRTDDIKEHYLYISTPESIAFTVTLKDGGGNILATPMISSASSYEYYIGDGQLSGSKMVVPVDSLNVIL